MTARAAAGLPELGSLLGGMIRPPGEQSPVEAGFERVRLELLTALFDRAGTARALLAGGDEAAARAALAAPVWLEAWEQAVGTVTRTSLEEIERRIREAAAESRISPKRLVGKLPDAEERRVLLARLSAVGMSFETATELLNDPARPWNETVRRVAGELEAAWEALLAAARAELGRWDVRAAEVRAWRRPWRPLLVAAAVFFPLAFWLGLMLGGYVRAPAWLRPLTDWIWNL